MSHTGYPGDLALFTGFGVRAQVSDLDAIVDIPDVRALSDEVARCPWMPRVYTASPNAPAHLQVGKGLLVTIVVLSAVFPLFGLIILWLVNAYLRKRGQNHQRDLASSGSQKNPPFNVSAGFLGFRKCFFILRESRPRF